jgi:hypothetical protein
LVFCSTFDADWSFDFLFDFHWRFDISLILIGGLILLLINSTKRSLLFRKKTMALGIANAFWEQLQRSIPNIQNGKLCGKLQLDDFIVKSPNPTFQKASRPSKIEPSSFLRPTIIVWELYLLELRVQPATLSLLLCGWQ